MTASVALGYAGVALSVFVLFTMAIRYAVFWIRLDKSNGTIGHPTGGYSILAGCMVLLLEVSNRLLDGESWYRGLIPIEWSDSDAKIAIDSFYPLLGYGLIILGLFIFRSWRMSDDRNSKRTASKQ